MECILDCNYLLLEAPLRRESNTIPQGYGMYLRLKLSLVKGSTGWSGKIQFRKDMECISVYCIYLFLKNSAKERVKYSYAGIWNVFRL